ncbi:MAG: hypothetical protein NC390_04025 [Fusobacterium sp.]|nr:hypothetical protein [Fusobacterium sp.]
MNNELIITFKILLEQFSREHAVKLSSLYPFSANNETIAVMGLQSELQELEQELRDYITKEIQNLTYGCTISEFHINDEPTKMVIAFDIN